MSKQPPEKRLSGSSDEEITSALQEVIADDARRKAAMSATRVRRVDGGFFVQVTLVLSGAFLFYLLLFSPTWIAPAIADPITVRAVDDGLRVSIFITARQIEAFRAELGRLPTDMEEAGGGWAGVVYLRVGPDTYRLSATTRETELTYLSSDPLDEFVGGSFRIMGGLT